MTADATDAWLSEGPTLALRTTLWLLPLFETALGDEEACVADPLYIGLFQMRTQTSTGRPKCSE